VHPDSALLFEQADALYNDPKGETDLRRAISAAYYALFHYTLKAAADLICGVADRGTPRYNLVYRSIDHGSFKNLHEQIKTKQLNDKIRPYAPAGGFGLAADFIRAAVNVQEERNWADYDPMKLFTNARARQAISDARNAIKFFEDATAEQRAACLMLLLFKPR
jgi:uncharacterized protein (UPF0332 family)